MRRYAVDVESDLQFFPMVHFQLKNNVFTIGVNLGKKEVGSRYVVTHLFGIKTAFFFCFK